MIYVIPALVTISALNAAGIDADLDLKTYKLKSDHLAESTVAHGIVLDDNTIIETGITLNSIDTSGSIGANLLPQVYDVLGVAMGGNN